MRAFSEAYRVTKKRAVFSEEFREAQSLLNLFHLRRKDYFRWSYKNLEKVGFKVLKFEVSPLNKSAFKVAIAVCVKVEKRPLIKMSRI